MSIYRYAGGSAIKEAVFHHAKDRPPVALLTASDSATPDQLATMRNTLEKAGWQSVPAFAEGKPVLQVSGFKTESELNSFLRAQQYVEGLAAITPQKGDNPISTSGERIQRVSLKLTGWLNLIGNTVLVTDGIKKKDPFRATGGGLLALGAINLARHGNAPSAHYTQEAAEDLAEFVRSQGGTLPPDSALAAAAQHKKSGPFAKTEKYLYRHPAEVTLGIDSLGSASNLISGIRSVQRDNKSWGSLGFGVSSLGLKIASLVIPEKPDPSSKKKHGGIIGWIQEKPLRLYGFGSLVSDVFLGADAVQQFRKNPGSKGYILTAISAASYTMADILISISSKNHVNADGKFDADEQRGIEALAAEVIASQPEQARAPMAQKLAGFLATRKEMRGDGGSISRSIIEQAKHTPENPWVNRIAADTTETLAQRA